MATRNPNVQPVEVLPPEAQNMHPFNKPVAFNLQNTLQSPIFWMVIGAAAMFGISHYYGKHRRRD